MKSDLYIKWDIYAKQNDNNFRRYCYRHIGYGFEVFFTTAIILKMNDGNAISKEELIESIQAETLIESDKVANCVESLIELNLLKEEDGKYYSARIRRDVEKAKETSKKNAESGSKGGKAKANANQKDSESIATANQTDSECIANANQTLDENVANANRPLSQTIRQLDNKTIRQETSNKEILASQVKEKRFVKPTVEEVRAYCTERKNFVDPDEFCDFYESKGWRIGKEPMKDWKASVRTWERNGRNATTSTANHRHYNPEDFAEDAEKLARGEDIF